MLNSRDISLLRSDVAANCRALLTLCKEAGLPVLITGTVRDEEYQLQCYNNGYSKAKVPSFHSVKAGLAFDLCKNVKGQEYSDSAFFIKVATLAKEMGFSWGGDWTSIIDKPHFQWDENGAYNSSMIRAGNYPPTMPKYQAAEEEETVTQDQFNTMMETYLAQKEQEAPADWSSEARTWAEENGIIAGDGAGNMQYRAPCTREMMVVFLYRVVQYIKQIFGK